MGSTDGYDEQFNDGVFRVSMRPVNRGNSPASITSMRKHTSYGEGVPYQSESAHSDFTVRRPHWFNRGYNPYVYRSGYGGFRGNYYRDNRTGAMCWLD